MTVMYLLSSDQLSAAAAGVRITNFDAGEGGQLCADQLSAAAAGVPSQELQQRHPQQDAVRKQGQHYAQVQLLFSEHNTGVLHIHYFVKAGSLGTISNCNFSNHFNFCFSFPFYKRITLDIFSK